MPTIAVSPAQLSAQTQAQPQTKTSSTESLSLPGFAAQPSMTSLLQKIMQQLIQPATPNDYDLRFRENMVKTANNLGAGWAFSEDLVHINNGELTQPKTRSYTSINGQAATETVLERNNLWEVVQRGANRYLLMRETDNAGQPVKPSDAINDVFNNRQDYAFDCASPMRLLNLKATLETIGIDDFDSHAGRLQVSSWYDKDDSSGFDGGFSTTVRTTTQSGEFAVNGVSNLKGETALFDPTKGDALKPGSAYYFDLPVTIPPRHKAGMPFTLGGMMMAHTTFGAPILATSMSILVKTTGCRKTPSKAITWVQSMPTRILIACKAGTHTVQSED